MSHDTILVFTIRLYYIIIAQIEKLSEHSALS